MKSKSLPTWKDAARGLFPALLVLAVVFSCETVGASESYEMPGESEAYRNAYTGTGESFQEVAWVKSLRRQEDRVFLNGEAFVLRRETRIEEEQGGRIRLEDIPVGAQIEVWYRTGSTLEDSGYGPKTRILSRIRVLEAPQGRRPLR